MTHYRIAYIVVTALVLSLLAGCMPVAAPTPAPQPAAEKTAPAGPVLNSVGKEMPADAAPPDKQVLNLLGREEKHLDISAGWYEGSVTLGSTLLSERLTILDENYDVLPAAAETWEVSDDGLTWTFHLRPGALWSDGKTPVTAQDFEFALKRALDPATGNSWAWFYYDIKGALDYNTGVTTDRDAVGVKAVDDLTLAIETTVPAPYLPLLMAFPSGAPVPREMVEKYGDQWSLNPETMLSNGPFILQEWTRGKRTVLLPNPYYNGKYKPYLEKIIFQVGDMDNTFLTYQAGEIDLTHDIQPAITPADLAVIEADPQLKSELHAWPYPATFYMYFKTQAEPFNNLKVRQAFSHAIDRDILVGTALKGTATPAYTMLPPGFPGFAADELKNIQAFDPELARKLLAEAGYPDGKGFPAMKLWMPTPTSSSRAAMEVVQAMLKENLNINVELVAPSDRTAYNNAWNSGEIQLAMISWSYDYIDQSDFLDLVWHSRTPRHDWRNAEFDRITDEAKPMLDAEKRTELYKQAEKLLVEDVGGVFLWHPLSDQLWKPYVKGIPTNRFGYQPFFIFYKSMMDVYIGE
jgi:ABC-type oligopeptide transport system substrate-binding subunit